MSDTNPEPVPAPDLKPIPAQLQATAMTDEQRDATWASHIQLRKNLREEHALTYLFLEVTRACNLSCAYCGSSCGKKPQREELSIEQWLDVVRQVAEDFNPADIMVAVTGGEPLTKPGIFELFAELHRLGFHYGMVSNAFLLDADAAKRLVEVGMDSLSLSMDAPPPLNDQLRGEGATLAVFNAVAALDKAGYRGILEIISTITKPVVPLLERRSG
jgi:MoaA/NifB/PqqE/SkfB family radical SAM enzyme